MSDVIYKYSLLLRERSTILMPEDARALSCQMQNGVLQLWAVVDPSLPVKEYHFRVVGTGNLILFDLLKWKHLDTVQTEYSGLVWHIFWHPHR